MMQAEWPDFNNRKSASGTFTSLTAVASCEHDVFSGESMTHNIVIDEPPYGAIQALKFQAHETLEVFFVNKNSRWYFACKRSKGLIVASGSKGSFSLRLETGTDETLVVPAHYLKGAS
jgi:hypothetical protein